MHRALGRWFSEFTGVIVLFPIQKCAFPVDKKKLKQPMKDGKEIDPMATVMIQQHQAQNGSNCGTLEALSMAMEPV